MILHTYIIKISPTPPHIVAGGHSRCQTPVLHGKMKILHYIFRVVVIGMGFGMEYFKLQTNVTNVSVANSRYKWCDGITGIVFYHVLIMIVVRRFLL